ncbi:unnamed protein product [Wickerhamomyces anomalus]
MTLKTDNIQNVEYEVYRNSENDGYQQGVMTMANAVLSKSFKGYTTKYKTMVSNSILVANIIGQIAFGFITDRVGILGCGVGGEYPTSASASIETANEKMSIKNRVTPFIMSTNFFVAAGIPIATIVFLIVHEIWGPNHLNGIWRTCFAIGAVIPISIFYFRWKLDHANSYKTNAIKRKVSYKLVWKKYWKEFVSTAAMWFFMDMIVYPNNIFSTSILAVAIPKATLKRTGE